MCEETSGYLDQTSEYLRALDSLARYFNSQHTVHVGYLLTAFGLLVGSAIAILPEEVRAIFWMQSNWGMVMASCIAIVMLLAFPVLPLVLYLYVNWRPSKLRQLSLRYLLGRIAFYYQMSRIVWDHMQVTSYPDDARILRKRITERGLNLNEAITSLFEARLYVSKCKIELETKCREEAIELEKLSDKERELLDKEFEKAMETPSQILPNKKPLDPFLSDISVCPVRQDHYTSGGKVVWKLMDLLLFAYSPTLEGYNKAKKGHINYEKATLFKTSFPVEAIVASFKKARNNLTAGTFGI